MGNSYTEIIDIPNNKISVNTLKKIINDQLGIEPSYQHLTYQIDNKTIIALHNEFPLFFFDIRDYSTIFLENFKNYKYKHKTTSRSPISMKYMNRLGYHFQYSKKFQSVKNLLTYETKSSSNSDTQINDKPLSDDEVFVSKKSNKKHDKEEENEAIELVINNGKEGGFNQEKENNNNDDKIQNEDIVLEKLINLIKNNDFGKIKSFFVENKLDAKNDDLNLGNNIKIRCKKSK